MKTFKWSLILATIMVIFFSSCQREIDGSQNGTTQNDSVYIQSLIILDTTRPAGQDTIFKYQFFYDAAKRLSKRVSFEYWSMSPPPVLVKTENLFSYQGSDKVPSVIYTDVVNYVNPGSSYKDTLFFFYQNGMIVKDSFNFLGSAFLNDFAKLGATRYRYIRRQ